MFSWLTYMVLLIRIHSIFFLQMSSSTMLSAYLSEMRVWSFSGHGVLSERCRWSCFSADLNLERFPPYSPELFVLSINLLHLLLVSLVPVTFSGITVYKQFLLMLLLLLLSICIQYYWSDSVACFLQSAWFLVSFLVDSPAFFPIAHGQPNHRNLVSKEGISLLKV